MIVSDFINSVRFPLNDSSKMTYSDSQICESLNTVLNIVNNALIKLRSNILLTKTTLSLIDGCVDLPENFVSISSVQYNNEDYQNYKITGNTLYSDKDILDIEYRFAYTNVNETDNLPVPDYFSESLKKFIVMLITGKISPQDKVFFDLIYSDLSSIVSGREFATIDREIPFYI